MADRRDKLGRRIPEFDRSAAGRKSAKTQKEKYGPTHHKRIGTIGARMRTPGNFGKLKAEDPEKFEELSKKGGLTGVKHFARLKEEDPQKLKELSVAGGKVKPTKSVKRDGAATSGG